MKKVCSLLFFLFFVLNVNAGDRLWFTSDGKYLVSGLRNRVFVWNVETGKVDRKLGKKNDGGISALCLSQNDRYLAVSEQLVDPHIIQVYDFRNGKVIGQLLGHTKALNSLAFSSDNQHLASGSTDGTLRLWDVEQKKIVHLLKGHTNAVAAVAFSPDGKRIVSGSHDKTLRLWDVREGKAIGEMKGHTDKVLSVAFSLDGRYIASGSRDRTLRLWDGKTGEFIKELMQSRNYVMHLAFIPDDSSRLLTGTGGRRTRYTCHVVSTATGKEIARFRALPLSRQETALSRNGDLAATGGGDNHKIYLWNIENGKVIRKLVYTSLIAKLVGFLFDVDPPRLKDDGETFEGEIWIVDISERDPQQLTILGGYRSPIFSPDDQNILALKGNHIVCLPVSGGEVRELHEIEGIVKMIGFNKSDPDKILILLTDELGGLLVGILSRKSGAVSPVDYNRESNIDRQMIDYIKRWHRIYSDVEVYTERQTKVEVSGPVAWHDVFFKQDDEAPVNLSNGDGVTCGQPSLSHDHRQVVFIKAK